MTRTINKGTPVLSRNPLELWEKAAGRYIDNIQGADAFFRSAYCPVIDAMIGNVNDKDILDAGCGNGFFSKKLACAGAHVFGIDGSSEMICRAEQENEHPMATYNVMDLTHPLPLESESMDVILANMVLMDLPDIETCMAEFSRILRKNGIFIISITHPAFFSSDWTGDESNPKLGKVVCDYLHTKIEPLDFWGETLHYHRPLSYYAQTLEKNGLCILSLAEPVPLIPAEETDPNILCHERIPSFLVVKVGHR